ncbi:MAG: scaffold protein [Microviridae sp. ctKAt32]|nr:MAG: scaffold protein [Microviridae sp. ctKAt32]
MTKDKTRKPFALYCDEPSITKQSFKEECDINEILKRAKNGQDISVLFNQRVKRYGDFTNVPDYRDALDLVNRAEGMFMELEAKVRERFANDPARMIAFLQDPGNREEAERLGLVMPKKEVKEPAPASAPGPAAGAPEPKAKGKDEPPKGAATQSAS